MATGKDSYLAKLDKLLGSMEDLVGLNELMPSGERLTNANISDVIQFINAKVKTLSKEEISSVNISVGKNTVLISYISGRLTFYRKLRLDYSVYPCMDVVANVLLEFRLKSNITQESLRNLNKIVCILSEIDTHYLNYRFSLSYRFLRIFLIMIVYGNYCNASIIASFILEQLTLEGDAI